MTTRKILLINGHPDELSFCNALADAYQKGAHHAGHQIQRINLTDLKFDPNLHHGYRIIQPLEPDLIKIQQNIKWANHLVFVYPSWWTGTPALMKGFIDRTLLPAFGFRYHKNSLLWDKLLTGRSARLLITMDSPLIYNRLIYHNNGQTAFTKGTLKFCGIKPVKCDIFSMVRFSSPQKRQKWLKKAESRGKKGC